ncbi:MAG: flagellar biosynthesis protein FlhF, partial [Lachnospiraceae bacterium]|nr:flagellar biosynthesis protein FlhF [Lachnospiraceae bacterium]
MIIKKFQAKNEEEALALAKKELGSEVTMIHSRNVKPKGFFSFLKKMQVEITVAKEEEMDRPEVQAKSAIAEVNRARKKAEEKETKPKHLDLVADDNAEESKTYKEDKADKTETAVEEKLDNIQSLLEQKLSKRADEEKERERKNLEEAKEQDAERKEMLDFCRLLHRTLLENEVTENNANELVDEIRQNYASGMTMEHMLSYVYQKIILKFGKPVRIAPSEKGAKVVFFIGPTGVGKTTTLAKVASRFRLMENKQVALFTTDTYRISATDQLKTYANILGVPFHVIYEAKE